MNDWFFMLGEPLSASEQAQARDYLRALGVADTALVQSVPDFSSAARVVAHPDWDRRPWDAEQGERERLRARVGANGGEEQLLTALSAAVDESISGPLGAIAVQAARMGCSDAGLIRAAAGALGEALYLARLAELAHEPASHPFLLKKALFAGGHWPLGVVSGRFYVF